MANSFGVLNNTLLAYDALSLLVDQLPPVGSLVLNVTDYAGGRYAKPGELITIKEWSAAFTPYTVGTAGYVAPDYTANTSPTVTLPNAPIASSMYITAADYRLISSGESGSAHYKAFLDQIRVKIIEGMATKIGNDWFATIGTNYTGKTVNAVGAFTRSTEIDLDTKLFTRKVPRDNATLMLNPTTYAEWAKDHVVVQTYTAQNQANRLFGRGYPSAVSGFNVFRTNLTFPIVGTSDRGFAYTKTASIFASRIPDEPSSGDADPVSLAECVDPQTGINMLSRLWKNAATGQLQLDFALLYAFAPGQLSALERISST